MVALRAAGRAAAVTDGRPHLRIGGVACARTVARLAAHAHRVGVEGRPWGPQTAIAGAADRLAPILMTSIVTALGLLPLAIGMNEPGREIEGPMALVIVGGLATSMALNLLVLPTLALQFGKFGERDPEFTDVTPAPGSGATAP